jgi:hypothetical protein
MKQPTGAIHVVIIESLGYPSPWPGSLSRYWASRTEGTAEKLA